MSAEESDTEPELAAEDDDEAVLSRRGRGTTGESEALNRAFMVPLLVGKEERTSNAITKEQDTEICDACGGAFA